jgi:hypothetical protein
LRSYGGSGAAAIKRRCPAALRGTHRMSYATLKRNPAGIVPGSRNRRSDGVPNSLRQYGEGEPLHRPDSEIAIRCVERFSDMAL